MSSMVARLTAEKILVVFALEQESQGLFVSFQSVYCGVGKINATFYLTQALARYRAEHGYAPALVLNLGSAGSAHFNRGEIINCTEFIQRDFDVTALGCAPYTTPFDDVPARLTGVRYAALTDGVCGSGDGFVTDASTQTPWNVVDMEAYALAKVCAIEDIAFACLKYITDGADGHAATAWQDGLKNTAKALHQVVTQKIIA